MHEYEFRFVIQDSSSFLPLLQTLNYPIKKQTVHYAKPHFRLRNRKWETKHKISEKVVYFDGLWFRWIHSVEKPYSKWEATERVSFLDLINFQEPLKAEVRYVVTIDSQVKLYAFQTNINSYKLVFEWEYGTLNKRLLHINYNVLFKSLGKYKHIYNLMRSHPLPFYVSIESQTRRPVTTVSSILYGSQYLYAHKLDGIFGLVYSYVDEIKEKWEDYECRVRKNVTLGEGFVFAAEKMEDGKVFLLDVYKVRGNSTAGRRRILLEFLPSLTLSEGYYIQSYFPDYKLMNPKPLFKTDGIIIHDTDKDCIYKYKYNSSIDLVYIEGYFYLPNGRIKCPDTGLEDGCVYEISTADGTVMRKRSDRFKGNTKKQLQNILKDGWLGPPIEPLHK